MAALIIALIVAAVATGAIYSQPAARAAAGGAWRQGSAQARSEAARGWTAARRRYAAAQAHLSKPIQGMDGKLYPPGPRNWQWWWGHALRATAGGVTAAGGAAWAAGNVAVGAARVGREAIRGGKAGYQRHRDTVEVDAIEVTPDTDPAPSPETGQPTPHPRPGRPASTGDGPDGGLEDPATAGPRICRDCGHPQVRYYATTITPPGHYCGPCATRRTADPASAEPGPAAPAEGTDGTGGYRRLCLRCGSAPTYGLLCGLCRARNRAADKEEAREHAVACDCEVCTGRIPPKPRTAPDAPAEGSAPVDLTAYDTADQPTAQPTPLTARRFYPPADGQALPRLRAGQLRAGDRICVVDALGEREVVAVQPLADGQVRLRMRDPQTGHVADSVCPAEYLVKAQPVTQVTDRLGSVADLAVGAQIIGADGAVAEILSIEPTSDPDRSTLTLRDLATSTVRDVEVSTADGVRIRMPARPLDHAQPSEATSVAARDLAVGDEVIDSAGNVAEVTGVTTTADGQRRIALHELRTGETVTTVVPGNAYLNRLQHLPDFQTDAAASPIPMTPVPGSPVAGATPTVPSSTTTRTTTTERNTTVMTLQAEATSLAAVKATLSGEIAAMDQRVATLDSLMSSLSGKGMDADTINGLSAYQDDITNARNRVSGLLSHVEARHNQVAEAIAAAGGAENVADLDFYDEA